MGNKAIGDEASVPTSLLMGGVMLTVFSQPMKFRAGYCDNLLATHVVPLPSEEEKSGRSVGPLHLCYLARYILIPHTTWLGQNGLSQNGYGSHLRLCRRL